LYFLSDSQSPLEDNEIYKEGKKLIHIRPKSKKISFKYIYALGI